MPVYVYRAFDGETPLDEYFEFFQGMKEDSYTKHPETGQDIRRVPQIPMAVQMEPSKPKTLGAIAEKNTARMVAEESKEIKKKEDKRPWWRPSKDKPVDSSNWSPTQTQRYIMEGKQP